MNVSHKFRSPAKMMRRMNVGRESGEEIGADIGRREEAVEVAAELVGLGGETWWSSGVEESTAGLRKNRHQFVKCWWCCGFGDFGRRERGNGWGRRRGRSFTRRDFIVKNHHLQFRFVSLLSLFYFLHYSMEREKVSNSKGRKQAPNFKRIGQGGLFCNFLNLTFASRKSLFSISLDREFGYLTHYFIHPRHHIFYISWITSLITCTLRMR